jgi:predicted PurR-regulated permease PerM
MMPDVNSAPKVQSTSGGLTEGAVWRVAVRTVLFVLAILFAVWLAVQLRTVLVQVVLAIILSAGMTPLVDRFTISESARNWRWRPARSLVVLLVYLALIAAITGVGLVALPPLVREIRDLVGGLPADLARFQVWLETLPSTYPFLPADLSQGIARQIPDVTNQLAGLLRQALFVVDLALDALGATLTGIFTMILALYITADSNRILRYFVAFLPQSRQVQACRVAEHIGQRLGGWVRGQLLLSAIIGTMTLVGLTIIGVPYAILLSLVAAIGEAVPLIGPIVSAVPAVIIAFFQSPVQGFLTLGLYILIQQLENHLVVPKVMGRAVSLHPVAVMLALLAGSELMGITGAILAVPVTAALSVIVDEVRWQRIEHGMVQPSVASATDGPPLATQAAEPAVPLGGD